MGRGYLLFRPSPALLFEVWLPYEPSCQSVGWLVGRSVCHNSYKGRKLHFLVPIGALVWSLAQDWDEDEIILRYRNICKRNRIGTFGAKGLGKPSKLTLSTLRLAQCLLSSEHSRDSFFLSILFQYQSALLNLWLFWSWAFRLQILAHNSNTFLPVILCNFTFLCWW